MGNIIYFLSDTYFLIFFAAILAFFLSVKIYPIINFLAYKKNLMDTPGERSAHFRKTPNLGGVGLFIAFSLSTLILASLLNLPRIGLIQLIVLMAAISILFFLGVRDDLIGLSPFKKIAGQSVAAGLVILLTNIRIYSLDGLFGIGDLPYIVSVVLTIMIFIFLVNAFNLIDGIDGLAGSIAIIASMSFGVFFLINGYALLALISLILIGTLIGFLKFNLSERNKLFMGDSGSLFIGFLLAYQAICFIGLDPIQTSSVVLPKKMVLLCAVLSFPILDTLRVVFIRLKNKRHPFSADKNHLHHRLLFLGFTHKQATSIIALSNFIIIGATFLTGHLDINLQLFCVFSLVVGMGLLPCIMIRKEGVVKFVIPKF